jgi:hypothetical protein
MAVIENLDVVMGAQTTELDAAVAKEIGQMKRLETAASAASRSPGIDLPKDSIFRYDFGKAASGLGAYAAGFATVTAAAAGTAYAISKVSEEWQKVDEASDVANRLGMSFAELNTSRIAIGRSTGMDDASVDASMQKMNLNLANAVAGGNEPLVQRLAMLGLEAGELLKVGPLNAIKEISAATKDLSPSDQMIVAYETFGKSGVAMVNALREGPDALDEMQRRVDELGSNLSDSQVAQIGAAQDAWDDLSQVGTGFWRSIAAESAPVIQLFAEWATDTSLSMGGWKDNLEFAADTTVYFAGVLWDVYEVTSLIYKDMYNIATLNFSKVGEGAAEAFDFSTGAKNVEAIYQKRLEAEEKAAKDAAERKANATLESEIEAYERNQMELQKIEDQRKQEEQEQQRKQEEEKKKLIAEANQIQKQLDSMGNKPGRTGAVSAQEGSVEAYKLLLERDNEQKAIAEEAKQQTILQQRMADLLEQANSKPTIQLARAR